MRLLAGALITILATPAFAIDLFSGDEEQRTSNRSSGKPSLEQRVQLLERRINTLSSIVLRLDSLQQEMQQLRGEIEVQNHAMERMKQRQTDLYSDLEQRISGSTGMAQSGPQMQQPGQLPSQAVPSMGAAAAKVPEKVVPPAGTGMSRSEPTWQSSPIATSPPQPAQPMMRTETVKPAVPSAPVVTTTTTTLNSPRQIKSTQIAATRSPVAPTSTDSKAEKSSYQQAFNLLMDRKYDKAQNSFRSFLKSYPSSRLADNAQYWLAEANYVTRNFDTALIEFENVVRGYPNSDKISDALLKIGYIQYEKKQWGMARKTLGSLVSRYPNSTASQLAKKRLDKMRGQGR